MKIVFLNPTGSLGGAERSLLDLMVSMRQTAPGAELHLITFTEGPLTREAQAVGVYAYTLPMPKELAEMGDSRGNSRTWGGMAKAWQIMSASVAIRRYASRLHKTLQDLKPALVHSNGIKSHLIARLARLNGVPVVWHVRDFLASRPLMSKALRWAGRRAAGVIAVSEAVARDAKAVLRGVPVMVVRNAIDVDHFSPAPVDGRRLDDLAGMPTPPSGTLRVGLVATFAWWKGQDLFLEAAARTLNEGCERQVRFYIIGGPIYCTRSAQFSQAELRAKAARLNLAHRVGFIGFQHDTADVYRALDIVVHASTRPEPFGRTIVEAMACGKPVLVARAGGAVELFTHDHDAIGFSPNEVGSLASALGVLLDDPERRVRIAAQARRTAFARFSRRRLGGEVVAAYDRFTRDFTPRSTRSVAGLAASKCVSYRSGMLEAG